MLHTGVHKYNWITRYYTFDNNITVFLTKYMDIFIQHSQIFIRFLFSITFKSKKSNIKISKIDWNKKEAPEYV